MKTKRLYLVIVLLAIVFTMQGQVTATDMDFTGWENHLANRRLAADLIRLEQGAFVRPTKFESWRSIYWVKPNIGANNISISVNVANSLSVAFKQDGITKAATLNNGAFEASFGLNNGKPMSEIEVIVTDGASDRSYYLDVCDIDPQRHDVVANYYGLLPYPKTHNTTRALVDQITRGNGYNVTQKRIEFIANYFAGSQKNERKLIDPVKAINPNWHSLHYHLSIWWNGESNIIINNQWSNAEWQELISLYEKDPYIMMYAIDRNTRQTTWVKDIDYGSYLMNIINENYYQHLLKHLDYQCKSTGYESIFFDSFAMGVVYSFTHYNYVNFGAPGDLSVTNQFTVYQHPQLGGLTWLQASEEFISRINKDMNKRGIWMLPNHGNMTTTWDPFDYALTNGGMLEGVPGRPNNYSDWVQVMSRTMYLTQKDRVIILQPNGGSISDLNYRMFLIGEYLMVKGDYTYLNMCMSGQDQASWYPEYEIDLGAPTQTYTIPDELFTRNVDNALLNYQEGDLFVRRFEKGMVILNPQSSTRSYTIPADKAYKMAVISGGGTVPESGIENLSYSLNWTDVTGVRTIPAVSALILQFENPTVLTETITEKVNVYASNGAIQVTSSASNPIREVSIYNLQGKLIYKASAIRATSHTADLKQPFGIYIVKVITENNVDEVKVFIKKIITFSYLCTG